MPRYHFHTQNGSSFTDADGRELESVRDARIEAARAISQMVEARPDEFWEDGLFRVTVTDERGLILFMLDLSAIEAPAMRDPLSP